MNLELVKQKFIEKTKKNYDWEVQNHFDGSGISFETIIKRDDCVCEIATFCDVLDIGTILVSFAIGKMKQTEGNLQLINCFNDENVFMTCFIDEDDIVMLKYCCTATDEDNAIYQLDTILTYFMGNESMQYLKPLTLYLE